MTAQVLPLWISTRHQCLQSPHFLFSRQLTCEYQEYSVNRVHSDLIWAVIMNTITQRTNENSSKILKPDFSAGKLETCVNRCYARENLNSAKRGKHATCNLCQARKQETCAREKLQPVLSACQKREKRKPIPALRREHV